jgi:neurofibromin 1
MIASTIKAQFPGVDHYSYLGGFVFLRFYCSSMIAPHQYGLYDQPPGAACQRVLVLLSKVIQNLSNGVSFGGKEEFLVQLNDFINVNASEVRSFLDKVSVRYI